MDAELIKSFSLENAPANEAYPADVNGDGKMELLFLQSPGIFQSKIFNPGAKYWDHPYGPHGRTRRDDSCLTAMGQDGRILWQVGQPKPYVDGAECFAHCADQMLCCGDLIGNGRCEVALIQRNRLLLIEGATGRILRQTDLDRDNYDIILPVKTTSGTRLLLKNTERGTPPFWYGDPALIVNPDLEVIKQIPRSIGSGHSPRAFDINGDGNDEILIGYEAYDADGNHLWRMDGIDPASYDPTDHHVDQLQVGLLGEHDGPKERCLVYAGSYNAYTATLDGHCLWKQHLGHPQHVAIGNFAGGGRAQLAFLSNIARNNIFFLRHDGTIVNVVDPGLLWPEEPGRNRKAHSGEGFLVYPQGSPDGSDVVITRDWGWPRAVGLLGDEPFAFPFPGTAPYDVPCPRAEDETQELKTSGMPCDIPMCPRESYGVRVFDFDGDGRAEVLIHNLRQAWIFKPPYPQAGQPNTHAKLMPISGQGFYAA